MTRYQIKKQKDKDLALKLAIRCLQGVQLFNTKTQMDTHLKVQIYILKSYIGDKGTIIEDFFSGGYPLLTRKYKGDKR